MSAPSSDQPAVGDKDYAVLRNFSRELKIACDDLHADPFDADARAAVLAILTEQGPVADEALNRFTAAAAC
jgi:hypothetical protein